MYLLLVLYAQKSSGRVLGVFLYKGALTKPIRERWSVKCFHDILPPQETEVRPKNDLSMGIYIKRLKKVFFSENDYYEIIIFVE